jgi:arylsulfatase
LRWPDLRKKPNHDRRACHFGESTLGAVRIDDFKYRFIEQPQGWVGEKTQSARVGRATERRKGRFWRFVFVQQTLAKAIPTFN